MLLFSWIRPFQLCLALVFFCASSSHAQELGQAAKLSDEFAQGVRAFKAGELAQAQGIWQRMLEQYPQRPELLNNMGVLRSLGGDRKQASFLITLATKQAPFYASIAENWKKLNEPSEGVPELLLIQEWPVPGVVVPQPALTLEPPEPSSLRALLEAALLEEDLRPAPIAKLEERQVPALVLDQKAAPRVVAAAELPQAVPTAPPVPQASAAPGTAPPSKPLKLSSEVDLGALTDSGLEQALKQWMGSWEQRDVQTYLRSYGPAFKPVHGMNRAQWEKQRRARLAAAQQVKLQIRVVKAEPGPLPGSQWLQIIQHYQSAAFQDVSNKSLLWLKSGNGWFILRELPGPPVFSN